MGRSKAKPKITNRRKPGKHASRVKPIAQVLAEAKVAAIKSTPQALDVPQLVDVEAVKVGRPTSYTPELGKIICDRIASGWTMAQACKDLNVSSCMPWSWARCVPEFAQALALAKEIQYDAMSDQMMAIADDGTNDWMEIETKNGRTFVKLNDEAVRRSQLRIDTRKAILGAMRAKVWGTKKLDVTSGGEKLGGLATALMAVARETEENMDGPSPPPEAPAVVSH